MSEEIQFILELAVVDSQAQHVQRFVDDIIVATQKDEPETLLYEFHLSKDETRCIILERYRDCDAALRHIGRFEENFADRFFALFELQRFRAFGPINAALKEVLSGLGTTFDDRIGGFTRL